MSHLFIVVNKSPVIIADKLDQTAENGEFELQLDGIADTLCDGLDQEQASIFHGEKSQVHHDYDQVDQYQLTHHTARGRLKRYAEDFHCLDDIKGRQDEFHKTIYSSANS